jgi:hypothetical protein
MKPCKKKQQGRLSYAMEALLSRIPSISHLIDSISLLACPEPKRVILIQNGELVDLPRLLASSQELRFSTKSVRMTLQGGSLLIRLEGSTKGGPLTMVQNGTGYFLSHNP